MDSAIYNKLLKLSKSSNKIKSFVADKALESGSPLLFFRDVIDFGCVSGMVNGLCYYSETHEFYDNNYNLIEQIREEYEESVGEPIVIKGDLKNFLSWFSFEYISERILDELSI